VTSALVCISAQRLVTSIPLWSATSCEVACLSTVVQSLIRKSVFWLQEVEDEDYQSPPRRGAGGRGGPGAGGGAGARGSGNMYYNAGRK
jgi:hypothetical protein